MDDVLETVPGIAVGRFRFGALRPRSEVGSPESRTQERIRLVRILKRLAGLAMGWFILVPVFERLAPYWLIKWYWKVVNPLFALAAGRVPGLVLVETTGRRSGLPRQIPLGGRLDAGSLWVVVGHARKNASLRNIEANPRVRVRVSGKWHEGIATVVDDADARRRGISINPVNGLFQAMSTSDQVSVRIDLA